MNWKFTHVLNQFNGIGSGDFVFNADYIYRKPDSFSKYKDSSILLFAGGPSTNKLLDDELPKVDYFWSLNYFYKNDRLPKIDLAALGKEVDMGDKKLIDYIIIEKVSGEDLYIYNESFEDSSYINNNWTFLNFYRR